MKILEDNYKARGIEINNFREIWWKRTSNWKIATENFKKKSEEAVDLGSMKIRLIDWKMD